MENCNSIIKVSSAKFGNHISGNYYFEKKMHVVGDLFREFKTGCHKWYKNLSGTFTGECEKETNPVLIPREIEILSDHD